MVDIVTVTGQAPVCVFGVAETGPNTIDFGAAGALVASTPEARATTAATAPIRRPALVKNFTGFLSLIMTGES
ncbi:hypothetical protein [Nonomuraea sp. NPDC003214]